MIKVGFFCHSVVITHYVTCVVMIVEQYKGKCLLNKFMAVDVILADIRHLA